MPRKRAAAKPRPPTGNGILLRYRERDTAYGVTRQTLPRYAADNGPLTDEQYAQLEKLVPQKGFVSSKKNRLF